MYEEYNTVFLYGDVTYKTGGGDINMTKSITWDENYIGEYEEGSYNYEAIGPCGITSDITNPESIIPYNRLVSWIPIFSSATYDSVSKSLTLKTGEADIKIDTPKMTGVSVSNGGGDVVKKIADVGETKVQASFNYLGLSLDYIFWKSHFGDYFFNAQMPPTMHNIRHILRIYGLDEKYGGSNSETYLTDDVVYDTTQNTCVNYSSTNSTNIRPAVINVDCNLMSDFGFTQESDGSYTSSNDGCFVNIKPINDDMVQVKIVTVSAAYSSVENFIISNLLNNGNGGGNTRTLSIDNGYYETDGVYTIFATVPPYMHNILHMMKMCGWYGSYSVGGGEEIAV